MKTPEIKGFFYFGWFCLRRAARHCARLLCRILCRILGSRSPGKMFIGHLPIKRIRNAFGVAQPGSADMAWVQVCQVRRP
ncbi:MAG: hypothetical protein HC898_13120 [Phycisphaerales bacterium]|nr:hypothetical protein [Phycisphaerales bacterium]